MTTPMEVILQLKVPLGTMCQTDNHNPPSHILVGSPGLFSIGFRKGIEVHLKEKPEVGKSCALE